MAASWGGGGFAVPEPSEPLHLAAAWHDEGWRAWEAAPEVDAEGRPVGFTDIAPEPHTALYRAGIAAACARDDLTGLLVSMHGQGLYEKRLGLDGRPHPRAGRPPVVRAFLADQEALQRRLAARIGPGHEAWAWAGYRLLQAWDLLSLYLCWTPLLEGREGRLARVPRHAGDPGVDLRLVALGEWECVCDPYPFRDSPLGLPVRARVIPDRRYASPADLTAELVAAREREWVFTLHRS
jgi:hypothetical protein